MKRLILLSILLLSLIAGGLNAQNRVTTYQGSLIDATSDLPMTGTVQMTFELYTSQIGGSQLWSEIQNVTLEKGFFNVYLGSVNPFPTNLDLSKTLWLQITVGNGSSYPRTILTPSFSSMYADKAAIAGMADDVKDGIVTLEKLADAAKNMGGDLTGTLPNPKIRKGAFLEAIEPGSITQEMLSPNVSTRPSGPASGDLTGWYPDPLIAPMAVKTDRIDDLAVTTEKIGNAAVTAEKIANLAIYNNHITDNAIDTRNIVNAAITTDKINDLAVTTEKINDLAVTTGKIADAAVTQAKLDPNVSAFPWGPAGGDLMGTYPNPGVDALYGVSLASPALLNGDVYMYNAVTNMWESTQAGGDVIGDYNDITVTHLLNVPMSAQPIVPGEIYMFDGLSWIPAGSGGDVSGLYNDLQLNPDVVTTVELAIDAVTTENIADWNVTNAKLDDDAVTTGKIMDGEVMTADIADLNVTTIKLADLAVTTAKIDAEAVTTDKIADLAVTNIKLAGDAVTTDKILDGTIASADIALNTIEPTNVNLAAAGWNFTTLMQGGNDVLTTATPFGGDVNGTYDNIQLNANVVTNAELADDAVTTVEIFNGTILTEDIAASQITNPLMAANAINSANIIDGEINTIDIANQAVTTNKIDNLAVTTNKIDNLAVTNAKIANSAVDNAKIADLAVTATKISSAAQVVGQILKSDGAGNVVWANDNELSLPFDTTFADNGPAMSIIRNGGDGSVYYAEVQNPGTGAGFEVYVANGAMGNGLMSTVNGDGVAVTGIVENLGTGLAGYFENANFANNAPALFATSVATAVPAFVVYQQTANFGEVSAAITNGNAGSGSALFLENNAAGFDATPSNWVDNEDGTNGSATLVVSNLAHATPGMSHEAVAIRTYGDIEANSAIRGTDLIALDMVMVGNPYETAFAAPILAPDAMSDNLNIMYNTRVWGDLLVDNDGFFGNDVNVTNSLNALNVNATNGLFTDLDVTNNLTSVNAEIGTLTVNGVSYLRGDIINDNGALPVAINDDLDIYGNAYATGDLTVDGNIYATTAGTTGFFDFVDVASNLDVWGTMTATEGGIVNDLTIGGLTTTNDLVVIGDATIATGDLNMPVGDINLTAGKVYTANTVAGDPANTLTTKGYVDAADAAINVLNEPFITYSASAKLTNERVLVGGNGMNFDAATATMNIDNDATLAVTATQIGLNLANTNTWTGTQTYGAAGNGLVVTNNAQFNGSVRFAPVTLNAAATRANLATEITNGKTVIIYSSTTPAERNIISGTGLPVLAAGDAGRIVYLVNGDAVATLVVLGKNVQTSEAIALLWTGSAWVKFADGF